MNVAVASAGDERGTRSVDRDGADARVVPFDCADGAQRIGITSVDARTFRRIAGGEDDCRSIPTRGDELCAGWGGRRQFQRFEVWNGKRTDDMAVHVRDPQAIAGEGHIGVVSRQRHRRRSRSERILRDAPASRANDHMIVGEQNISGYVVERRVLDCQTMNDAPFQRVDDDRVARSRDRNERVRRIPFHVERHGRFVSERQVEDGFARIDVEHHEFVHGDGELLSVGRKLEGTVKRGQRARGRWTVQIDDAYGQALGRAVRRVISEAFSVVR